MGDLELGEGFVSLGFYIYVAALGFCFEHLCYTVREASYFDGRGDDLEEVGFEFREDEYVVYDSGRDWVSPVPGRFVVVTDALPFLMLRAGYDCADRVDPARDEFL